MSNCGARGVDGGLSQEMLPSSNSSVSLLIDLVSGLMVGGVGGVWDGGGHLSVVQWCSRWWVWEWLTMPGDVTVSGLVHPFDGGVGRGWTEQNVVVIVITGGGGS